MGDEDSHHRRKVKLRLEHVDEDFKLVSNDFSSVVHDVDVQNVFWVHNLKFWNFILRWIAHQRVNAILFLSGFEINDLDLESMAHELFEDLNRSVLALNW